MTPPDAASPTHRCATAPAVQPGPAGDAEILATVCALIDTRQTVLPKRLVDPGPTPDELRTLLELAAAAPDHGQLTPWRFIIVPVGERHRLAEVFARSLVERDPAATPGQVAQAREKAHRSPMLLLAVACLGPRDPDVPMLERMISMGAALQNMLLGAHALGYGASLTSGQAMSSAHMRALCALGPGEQVVCCVNVGTATRRSLRAQLRPVPSQLLTELPPAAGA